MRIFLLIFSFALIACGQNTNETTTAVDKNKTVGINEIVNISEVLSVSDFTKKIKNSNVKLLDVRTPDEFNAGAIDNAINIDYFEANFKDELLQLDKNQPLAIYCKSGGRSGRAAKLLKKLGFKEVYDLKGGYLNWTSSK